MWAPALFFAKQSGQKNCRRQIAGEAMSRGDCTDENIGVLSPGFSTDIHGLSVQQ
jgi:hypothetical protein